MGRDDDEDTIVRFENASWSGQSIAIQIQVSIFGSERRDRQLHIRCEEVLAFAIKDNVASSLEFTNDHPVLWRFRHDHATAFFCGSPADPNAAVGALYRAHFDAVGSWFSLADQLNSEIELFELLRIGNGQLARGPIPLLECYQAALRLNSVEVQIVAPYPSGGHMKTPSLQLKWKNESRAVLIGNSFVAGIGWSAE